MLYMLCLSSYVCLWRIYISGLQPQHNLTRTPVNDMQCYSYPHVVCTHAYSSFTHTHHIDVNNKIVPVHRAHCTLVGHVCAINDVNMHQTPISIIFIIDKAVEKEICRDNTHLSHISFGRIIFSIWFSSFCWYISFKFFDRYLNAHSNSVGSSSSRTPFSSKRTWPLIFIGSFRNERATTSTKYNSITK